MRYRTTVLDLKYRVEFLEPRHDREITTDLDDLRHRELLLNEGKRLFIDAAFGSERVPVRQFQKCFLSVRKRFGIPVIVDVIELFFGDVVSSGPDDVRDLSIVTAIDSRHSKAGQFLWL